MQTLRMYKTLTTTVFIILTVTHAIRYVDETLNLSRGDLQTDVTKFDSSSSKKADVQPATQDETRDFEEKGTSSPEVLLQPETLKPSIGEKPTFNDPVVWEFDLKKVVKGVSPNEIVPFLGMSYVVDILIPIEKNMWCSQRHMSYEGPQKTELMCHGMKTSFDPSREFKYMLADKFAYTKTNYKSFGLVHSKQEADGSLSAFTATNWAYFGLDEKQLHRQGSPLFTNFVNRLPLLPTDTKFTSFPYPRSLVTAPLIKNAEPMLTWVIGIKMPKIATIEVDPFLESKGIVNPLKDATITLRDSDEESSCRGWHDEQGFVGPTGVEFLSPPTGEVLASVIICPYCHQKLPEGDFRDHTDVQHADPYQAKSARDLYLREFEGQEVHRYIKESMQEAKQKIGKVDEVRQLKNKKHDEMLFKLFRLQAMKKYQEGIVSKIDRQVAMLQSVLAEAQGTCKTEELEIERTTGKKPVRPMVFPEETVVKPDEDRIANLEEHMRSLRLRSEEAAKNAEIEKIVD